MPTRPIDRLLFAQGGLCFFCQHTLSPADASVEHLVAVANGGGNDPDNTVACCKALNTVLGHMSLKEKLRVVLNQKGQFKCPNGGHALVKPTGNEPAAQRLALVISDLRKRGETRPRTLKTLSSTISALFQKKLSEQEVGLLVDKLQAQGLISISGSKVSYELPEVVAQAAGADR
jgi:HNH endonuclease